MARYVPRTYNNRRLLRIIIGIILSSAIALAVLFIALFFGLQVHIVATPEGPVLEIPFLMDDPPPIDEDRTPSMIGFFIGAISGSAQYWMLSKFYGQAATGRRSISTMIFVFSQFLLPFILLLSTMMILADGAMLVGIGMLAALFLCFIGERIYIKSGKKDKHSQAHTMRNN